MFRIWSRAPFLRILLPFLSGIVLATVVDRPFIENWCLSIFSLCIIPAVYLMSSSVGFNHRHWGGWAWLVVWVAIGWSVTAAQRPQNSRYHFSHLVRDHKDTVILQTLHVPLMTAKGLKTEVRVLSVNGHPTTGKAMAFLSSSFRDSLLPPGTALLTIVQCAIPDAQVNPFAFDYKQYLMRKYITHTVYLTAENVLAISLEQKIPWHARGEYWRESMLTIMKKYTYDDQVFGILSALVLGKTDAMDDDIMSHYSTAGAVHILAVSGLHVGLVYALLQPVFARLFAKRKGRWIKSLLPLALLWAFAGITGFSASVLRAAVMFSFFILADSFSMKGNPVNTLCASAVLLLAVNPMYVFDVGFQLSYAAVAGIVILQKKVARLVVIPNKWANQLWNLMAVSIVAQLATMPVTLVYFQQWPTYFLLSNLVAVPLSTLVLYIELALLMLHPIEPVAHLLGNLGCSVTLYMNEYVAWCSSLPHALLAVNWWSPAMTICSAGMLLFGGSWGLWCRPWHARFFLVFAAAAAGCAIITRSCGSMQIDAIVLHSRKSFAALVPAGNRARLIADEEWRKNTSGLLYGCGPILKHWHADTVDTLWLTRSTNHILSLNDVSLAIPFQSMSKMDSTAALFLHPHWLRKYASHSDPFHMRPGALLSACSEVEKVQEKLPLLIADSIPLLSVHSGAVCLVNGQWYSWYELKAPMWLRFFGVGLYHGSANS
jgi:competence protein ComEC